MTPEQFLEQGQDFETLLESKTKLPKGVRKHIRRLKEDGHLDEAEKYRDHEIAKRYGPQQKAYRELISTVPKLLDSNNSLEEGTKALETTWLLFESGEIDKAERTELLIETLDAYPGLEESVDLSALRDRINKSIVT